MEKIREAWCLILISLLIFSCREAEEFIPSEEYFVKYKINGELIEIRELDGKEANYIFDENEPIRQLTIQVVENAANDSTNALSITVRSEDPFQTFFQYNIHDPILYFNVPLARVNILWVDEIGDSYVANLLRSAFPRLTIPEEAIVVFEEFNSTHVKGTFEGKLIGPATFSGRGEVVKEVTEGEFYLPVINR